jgi:hypothetical protein
VIRVSVRTAARGAALVTCLVLSACGDRTDPAAPIVRTPVTRRPAARPAASPPEPGAVVARANVLRRDADAIRAECRQAAAGDWDRWQRETAPYRAALKAKVDALKKRDLRRDTLPEEKYEPLEGKNGFPLFEVGARESLYYLYVPEHLDLSRRERPVSAAHRWLRRRGIDLIFVVVPRMTEVYAEHFLDPCPPDGVVAPHVRRTLLELLEDDVELVDGFSLFRPVREAGPEYLYNTADPHWAPRAMEVMAREVAGRVGRYRFGAEARRAEPVVRTTPGPYSIRGLDSPGGVAYQNGWAALSERQQQLAAAVQPTGLPHVVLPDGRTPPDDPDSPVLVLGHSYVPHFRERLIKEMNLRVRTCWSPGQTTQGFSAFLREPELLDGCRVLVWVTTEAHLPFLVAVPPAVAAEPRPK